MLTKLKNYSRLLKNPNFERIIGKYSTDYKLVSVNKTNVVLIKESQFKYEIVEIYEGAFISHVICEKNQMA